MSRGLDPAKVQAALDRAAYKAVHGTREERSGRFLAKKPADRNGSLSPHPEEARRAVSKDEAEEGMRQMSEKFRQMAARCMWMRGL